jgi:hypothetical protein
MPEYLDPEIANEGEAATDWRPGAGPAPIVDMSKLLGNHKHFGRYFAPHVFKPFPAWIYHATEPERIVKTAKEAKEFGVVYDLEDNRYICSGDWKTKPVVKKKPDVHASGKSMVTSERAQGGASLEIMAQILQQMQKGQAAPPALNEAIKADPDYAAFVEFKAWKAAQDAPKLGEVAGELSAAEQKEILVNLAKEKDIHVDKRWSLERIKEALDEVEG